MYVCVCLFLEGREGREKEGKDGEREEEKYQCERETSVGCLSHVPGPETKPTTQACALTANQTNNPALCEITPN